MFPLIISKLTVFDSIPFNEVPQLLSPTSGNEVGRLKNIIVLYYAELRHSVFFLTNQKIKNHQIVKLGDFEKKSYYLTAAYLIFSTNYNTCEFI